MFEKNLYLFICRPDFLAIFRENINLVSRIPFSFFDPAFALRRRLKNPITQFYQKKSIRAVSGGN